MLYFFYIHFLFSFKSPLFNIFNMGLWKAIFCNYSPIQWTQQWGKAEDVQDISQKFESFHHFLLEIIHSIETLQTHVITGLASEAADFLVKTPELENFDFQNCTYKFHPNTCSVLLWLIWLRSKYLSVNFELRWISVRHYWIE